MSNISFAFSHFGMKFVSSCPIIVFTCALLKSASNVFGSQLWQPPPSLGMQVAAWGMKMGKRKFTIILLINKSAFMPAVVRSSFRMGTTIGTAMRRMMRATPLMVTRTITVPLKKKRPRLFLPLAFVRGWGIGSWRFMAGRGTRLAIVSSKIFTNSAVIWPPPAASAPAIAAADPAKFPATLRPPPTTPPTISRILPSRFFLWRPSYELKCSADWSS